MKKIFAVGDHQWLDGLSRKLETAQVGYRHAKTAKELTSYLKEEPSVVLCDLKMPKLSGRELASYFKKEMPSVVLCDLKMPKFSGFDVLRQIKDIDIPIVMVKDPATFDFATLTHVFEMKRSAPEELKSEQARAPKLSLSTAPELHNPRSGRLDARRVADFFGMAPAKLAKILGRSPQALHKTPDAESLQKHLAVFARIATSLLSAFEGKEQARIWLNSPNPDLDETRPIELVEKKRPDVVADLLEDALLGHPG